MRDTKQWARLSANSLNAARLLETGPIRNLNRIGTKNGFPESLRKRDLSGQILGKGRNRCACSDLRWVEARRRSANTYEETDTVAPCGAVKATARIDLESLTKGTRGRAALTTPNAHGLTFPGSNFSCCDRSDSRYNTPFTLLASGS